MQVVTTVQREMKVGETADRDPVRRVPVLCRVEKAQHSSKENGGESKVERGQKGILQEDVWRGRKLKKGRWKKDGGWWW